MSKRKSRPQITELKTAASSTQCWLCGMGLIDDVPEIRPIKVGKRQRRVISQPDIENILSNCEPEFQNLIHVALWTGARRSELLAMRYEHKTGGMIRIIGKGDKERVVPLVGKAKDILSVQDIGKVFRWTGKSTVSNMFRAAADKAGVDARLHDLRHTAATTMLAKGVMLSVVQRILGHSNIATTQIYADVLEETLIAEMKKMEETK